MSQPATRDYVMEGPKGGIPCEDSGVYVGILAGHRIDCAACGKRIKVVRDGYLAPHLVRSSTEGDPQP